MSRAVAIILKMIIPCGLGILLGFLLIKTDQWYQHRGLPKIDPFVFQVTNQFAGYYIAVNHYFDALTYKANDHHQRATVKDLSQHSHQLDYILQRAEHYYSQKAVKLAIQQFLIWKNNEINNPISLANRLQRLHWDVVYDQQRTVVFNTLRKAVGFYNIENQQDAETMLLVAKAEANLKAHPNNATFCTVMRQFPIHDPRVEAQQIAFLQQGERYCSRYYHQRWAWSTEPVHNRSNDNSSPYDQLSYAVYYQKYVLPEIPKVLMKLTRKDWKDGFCHNDFTFIISAATRNPKTDAKRVVWQQYHEKYCPQQPLYQQNMLNTPLACLQVAQYFCYEKNGCDLFERCQFSAGILFT